MPPALVLFAPAPSVQKFSISFPMDRMDTMDKIDILGELCPFSPFCPVDKKMIFPCFGEWGLLKIELTPDFTEKGLQICNPFGMKFDPHFGGGSNLTSLSGCVKSDAGVYEISCTSPSGGVSRPRTS